MPKKKQLIDDDNCPLCGKYMDVRCTGHREKPFIDGKTYKSICFCCFEVPNCDTFKVETPNTVSIYSKLDPSKLHTVEEMVDFGFNKKESTESIKAVQKSIKKHLKKQ